MLIELRRVLLLAGILLVPTRGLPDEITLTAVAPSTVGQAPDGPATDLMPYAIYGFAIESLAFSPDGKTLATGDGNGNLRFWEVATGKLENSVQAHQGWIFTIAWFLDGTRLVTAGKDRLIQIRDALHPERVIKTLEGHSNDVHAVALTADNATLVSAGDDRTVRVWDLASGQSTRIMTGHERTIPTVAVNAQQLIASGSRDHTIRFWDLKRGVESGLLRGNAGDVLSVKFSPDGKLLASASYDRTVRLWDPATMVPLNVLTGHTYRVYSVAFAPDGKQLASAGDHTARLWDLPGGRNARTFVLQSIPAADRSQVQGAVSVVAYSPDGRVLAIASTLGTVYLMSPDTGTLMHTLTAPIAALPAK